MKPYRLLLFIPLVFMIACNGPKQLVKKGKKYERARDYEQAVILYAEAYSKDPNNRDATKGMKKAGKKLLKEKLEEFYDLYYARDYPDAITEYKKSEKLVSNLKRRSVVIAIPDTTREHYNTAVSKLTRSLYMDAARQVDAGNYSKARQLAREIEKYDPDYDGLKNLKKSIEVDPIYSEAMNAYRKGEKARAISLFLEVQDIYPGYRSSKRYIDELKATSQVKLLYLPTENLTGEDALRREMDYVLEGEMIKLKNPLLQITNSTGTGYTSGENGSFPDEQTIQDIGKQAGVDKVLMVTIMNFSVEEAPSTENVKLAYLKERVLYYDPYYGQMSNYQYREIKYQEIMEETKISLQLRYRLLSVETGQLVYTDMINKSVINQVTYADYNGVTDDLYPTTRYISQTELRKWRSRFDAKADKKPLSELTKIVEEEVAKELASEMLKKAFEY